jgi:hypothetical protein
MPIIKNPYKINNLPNLEKKKQVKVSTTYDRGTELAFSGEDKAWRSKQKNKCLF